MARSLDLVALRSFVAVAETGSVTRAAGLLNLTQSAVSMQIKRLEESLGLALFLRAARRMALSPEGEQLLDYARRLLAINDEALARLTCSSFEGELRLGVPCDIVYPAIPVILKRLAALFPRVRVNIVSSLSIMLKADFARGALDAILTTERGVGAEGEVLAERDLVWVGAAGGVAWQRRPLRLGFRANCIFRPMVQGALEANRMPWEMAYDGDSEQAIEATVAADLAVTARLADGLPTGTEIIASNGALPDLGGLAIGLYVAPTLKGPAAEALLNEIRLAYAGPGLQAAAE